jgi:hypothetical protein
MLTSPVFDPAISALAPTDNVNIQIKDGKITVNGKALTDEQNAKYSSFLQKK